MHTSGFSRCWNTVGRLKWAKKDRERVTALPLHRMHWSCIRCYIKAELQVYHVKKFPKEPTQVGQTVDKVKHYAPKKGA